LIFHNAIFDIRALATIGITLSFADPLFTTPVRYPFLPEKNSDKLSTHIVCNGFHDTQLMSHACDNLGCRSNRPHALKELALHYLDISTDDETELQQAVVSARRLGKQYGWSLGKNLQGGSEVKYDYWMPRAIWEAAHQPTLPLVSPENVPDSWKDLCTTYAIQDVVRTLGLFFFFQEGLSKADLSSNYWREIYLLPITYQMEYAGMYVEPTRLERTLNQFRSASLEARSNAERCLGGININSGPQLVNVLAERGVTLTARTKKGKASTGAASLRDIAQYLESSVPAKSDPLVYNTHRALRSIVGFDPNQGDPGEERIPGYRTFVAGQRYLLNYQNLADSRSYLHPSFNQVGTHWTRYSSSNPNGQNISKQAVLPLRKVFGPPPGYVWVSIDYSQLELRLYAYASQDCKLIESFEQGHDFHTTVACAIYNITSDKITAEMRRIAKNTNFAIIYGASPSKINQTSGRPGTFDTFVAQFRSAAGFMQQVINDVNRDGFVHTLGGYRLYVPPDEPYKGLNAVIQGTAGEIVKNAMLAVCERGLVDFLLDGSAIVANIHDEIIYQFPLDYPWKGITRRIVRVMEQAGAKLGAVTPVEASVIRDNWAEAVPF
jgi:DNA polymerase-1